MTRVHIIGTGLIGTSIGLALSRAGYPVTLRDPSPTAQAIARDMGAGELSDEVDPDVVVVAAPPDVAARAIADALERWPHAVVTDVASMKLRVLDDVAALGADLRRYVGSHPMAGRERSGAVAARADLFNGRTWVICPNEQSDGVAVAAVQELATATGAVVSTMPAEEHDRAVAAVSHVPQLAASLVAARLQDLSDEAIRLSGQGIRDVTRIAESDPMLWTQILSGNAVAIAPVIDALVDDLARVRTAIDALANGDETGARQVLARTIADGQAGHARIPGKHGGAPTTYATLVVVVPDRPGELGRLFADIGDAGINLEDLRLEHGEGAPVGLAEVSVIPSVAQRLHEELSKKGWSVHE
ncbi:prephenate dehydrogenase [Yimella sp. cx-51]|uniref:prephenate dehydrogenase n=1 Tax=Yimella sp. cx-51 TaxID=2770551 RepID=UPI00165E8A4A|nr:prephenate dehydrogenase [Yimella sp. cx-51]MBC9957760.1 prephenate dehydrogenase [Yimella sp. cx-51]QTH36897.1 prephenate dehydrogenase [Yimella sp. cx-51]